MLRCQPEKIISINSKIIHHPKHDLFTTRRIAVGTTDVELANGTRSSPSVNIRRSFTFSVNMVRDSVPGDDESYFPITRITTEVFSWLLGVSHYERYQVG